MADTSNPGKQFLITGIVLGLGAAAAGAYILNSQDNHDLKVDIRSGGKVASLTDKAAQLKQEALTKRSVADVAPSTEEAWIPRNKAENKKEPRFTPLFFAPKLWQVADVTLKKNVVRDLLDAESVSLYRAVDPETNEERPVPNSWFFAHGLDDLVGEPTALTEDSDNDGFSNGEEFLAGTNPVDSKSMPTFASGNGVKMIVLSGDRATRDLVLSSIFDATGDISIAIFLPNGQRIKPARPAAEQDKPLEAGSSFGYDPAGKGANAPTRFRIITANGEAEEERMGMSSKYKYIEIEDTYTKVADQRVFRLRSGTNQKHAVEDVNAKFRMTAGPESGKEFQMQRGEEVDVPGFPGTKCKLVDASFGKKDVKDAKILVNGHEFTLEKQKKPAAVQKN